MHKSNGLVPALQADKTNTTYWHRVNDKTRSPSLPTLVGGGNGDPEIVKMWKDYFKGIPNSENTANESTVWNTAQTARRIISVFKCPCVLLFR